MPSFSLQTKNELARVLATGKCCKQAELGALLQMGSKRSPDKHRGDSLSFQTENAAVARKMYKLLKELFACKADLAVQRKPRLKKNNVYILRIWLPPQSEGLVARLYGTMSSATAPLRTCCQRACLRGIFLAGGSLINPEKTYHLEITVRDVELVPALTGLMKNFDLNPHVGRRKGQTLIYFKESDQISGFLNVIGAHNALLKFENIRVYKDVRNNVNRQVNCETANLNKTVEASFRQVENIEFIKRTIGLGKLPQVLREVAKIRLDYPDSNLRELGQMMTPPLGKSGVNHRLRRLEEIGKKLRGE